MQVYHNCRQLTDNSSMLVVILFDYEDNGHIRVDRYTLHPVPADGIIRANINPSPTVFSLETKEEIILLLSVAGLC